jgi:hypothetical protein
MNAEAEKPTGLPRIAPAPRAASSKVKGPLVHLGILVVAAIGALSLWTRDKDPRALLTGDVTVWPGRSGDVERIVFEGKGKKVEVEAKKDDKGRYFVGTMTTEVAPKASPDADAGADAAAPTSGGMPVITTLSFVSVSAAERIADTVAPFKALRALGKLGDDRAAEFGFDGAEITVTIKIGGGERKLRLGGPTPGAGDRYVKDLASGEVYAVKGETFRNLESPDTLMMERELHEWKDTELTSAKIIAGGKTRAIARGGAPDGKKFWADPEKPQENDETLGNWMSKLDRLRPTEYVLTAPKGEPVVRLEYAAGSRALGFVEVVKAQNEGGKFDYFLQTERTRLFAKVHPQFAEQLEQDISSAVK